MRQRLSENVQFDVLCHNDNHEYLDFDLTDGHPNSDRRLWVLTFVKGDMPYACKRMSDTDESDFGDAALVADHMCDFIIQHLSPEASEFIGRKRIEWERK